jgi:hypothetical protein
VVEHSAHNPKIKGTKLDTDAETEKIVYKCLSDCYAWIAQWLKTQLINIRLRVQNLPSALGETMFV